MLTKFFGIVSIEKPIIWEKKVGFVSLVEKTNYKLFALNQVKDLQHTNAKNGDELFLIGQLYDGNIGIDLINLEGNFIHIRFGPNEKNPYFQISTDKFGTRPLYYRIINNTLYYSNYFHAIVKNLAGEKLSIDQDSLFYYYHFGVFPRKDTYYKEIKKLPSGSRIIIKDNSFKIEKYFQLKQLYNDKINDLSENELVLRINKCLENSVKKRIKKNTAALAVSGGVDSGFIAKKIRENNYNLTGFNLSYGNEYDEHLRIDRLSQKYEFRIEKIVANEVEIIENLIEANQISNAPTGFNDAAMRFLSKSARKYGYDSLWDGDGADRLFFGMNSHITINRTLTLYDWLKKSGLLKVFLLTISKSKNSQLNKLYITFKNWENNIPPYYERKIISLNYDLNYEQRIYNIGVKEIWTEFKEQDYLTDVRDFFIFQSVAMCPELFFYPPAEQQAEMDMSPVSPYWDSDVVSLALSIPVELKVKKGISKYILRKAASLNIRDKYWAQKKIGLGNAMQYINSTSFGKDWLNEMRYNIPQTNIFEILKTLLPYEKVDTDRLIVLNLWRSSNNY